MESAINTSLEPVSFVIVGGGAIAQTHARYIDENKHAKLVAVIDPYESGRSLATRVSVPCYESLQIFLANTSASIDVYMICTPSNLHIKIGTEVIELAQPKVILVEKPISTDLESGEAFVKLAAEKGCTVAVGHHRRFHKAISYAKGILESGHIGSTIAVSAVWACKKDDGYFRSPWRISRKEGGGPIWTNLIHDLDCLNYLVESRVTSVWATPTIKGRKHPGIEATDSVDEGAAIMLRFANGVVGTIILADNTPSPYHWEAASGDNLGVPKADVPVESYRLFGTQGTLSVPDGHLWTYDSEDAKEQGKAVGWGFPLTRESVPSSSPVTYQEQIEHLVQIVQSGMRPVCSGEDGLDAVRVCQAVAVALEDPNSGPVRL